MTPRKKAEELFEEYEKLLIGVAYKYEIKQCALIAVDEVLKVIYYESKSEHIYWQEVSNEIQKL